jgi:hypothetical protein
VPQLRGREIQCACPGVEFATTIPISLIGAPGAALTVACAAPHYESVLRGRRVDRRGDAVSQSIGHVARRYRQPLTTAAQNVSGYATDAARRQTMITTKRSEIRHPS